MGEIRLICPGCEAEYRLPGDAIPATGREVECTACGHVWMARPEATHDPEDAGEGADGPGVGLRWWPAGSDTDDEDGADEDGDDPALGPGLEALPAGGGEATPGVAGLHRALPDDVLSILRDEVEHERRARMAEDAAFGRASEAAPPEDGGPDARPASEFFPGRIRPDEADWPATTISAPAEAFAPQAPMRDPGLAPGAASAGPDSDEAGDGGDRAAPSTPDLGRTGRAPDMQDRRLHAPGLHAAELHTAPHGEDALFGADFPPDELQQPARDLPERLRSGAVPPGEYEPQGDGALASPAAPSGYGTGFGLAAMIAAIGLAAYLLAPGLADAGAVGEALAAYRTLIDDARLWLQGVIGVSLT